MQHFETDTARWAGFSTGTFRGQHSPHVWIGRFGFGVMRRPSRRPAFERGKDYWIVTGFGLYVGGDRG